MVLPEGGFDHKTKRDSSGLCVCVITHLSVSERLYESTSKKIVGIKTSRYNF